MKILACHIENFGKLHDVTFSFADGANPIREKNGWGKSTLAAFIRVMLYGFENERARDELTNERRRFAPWQGGVYGGTLTFSVEGGVYTVSRTFGAKEKEDTFSLRDEKTNLLSNRFSAHLGEELFLVDSKSFVRTVFLTQNDCRTEATDGVNAKLGNMTELSDDMNRFAQTDARLHELLNAMSPRRKTGALARKKEEISMCAEAVRKKDALEESLAALAGKKKAEEEQLGGLQRQRNALREMQRQLAAYQDAKARLAACATLQEEVNARAQQADAEAEAFGDTAPTSAQLEDCIDGCTQFMGEEKLLQAQTLTGEETETLARLRAQFDEEMRTQTDAQSDSADTAARLQTGADAGNADREESAGGGESPEEWLDVRMHALKRRQRARRGKMRALGMGALFGTAAGLVLLLAGVFAGTGGFLLPLAGTVLLMSGLVFLACVCHLQKKDAAYAAKEQENLHLLRDDADRLRALAGREAAYTAQQEKCRILSDALRENVLALFPTMCIKWECASAQDAATERDDAANVSVRDVVCVQSADDLFDFLQEKRAQLQHYTRTKEELTKAQETLAGLLKQEDADKLRALVAAYEAKPDAPREAETLSARQAALLEECERRQALIADYARQTDGLLQQEDELLRQEETLDALREEYEKEKKRYAIVEKTQKYLQQAKTSLTARYMQPLLEGFGKYYRLLTGEEPTAYRLDANTQLTVDACGQQRDIRALSAGLGDLTGVCMRLALVDAMYPDEKPFLVLDDPFVNLDSEKRSRAGKLLDALAAHYQILYMTCN